MACCASRIQNWYKERTTCITCWHGWLSQAVFDHSEEKVKSDDAGQADLKFIYPDMNQVVVVNLYLTRVIPSEYLKVYLELFVGIKVNDLV